MPRSNRSPKRKAYPIRSRVPRQTHHSPHNIPYDKQFEIGSILPIEDLTNLCSVSSNLNVLCKDEVLWKKNFEYYFGRYMHKESLSLWKGDKTWYQCFKKLFKRKFHIALQALYYIRPTSSYNHTLIQVSTSFMVMNQANPRIDYSEEITIDPTNQDTPYGVYMEYLSNHLYEGNDAVYKISISYKRSDADLLDYDVNVPNQFDDIISDTKRGIKDYIATYGIDLDLFNPRSIPYTISKRYHRKKYDDISNLAAHLIDMIVDKYTKVYDRYGCIKVIFDTLASFNRDKLTKYVKVYYSNLIANDQIDHRDKYVWLDHILSKDDLRKRIYNFISYQGNLDYVTLICIPSNPFDDQLDDSEDMTKVYRFNLGNEPTGKIMELVSRRYRPLLINRYIFEPSYQFYLLSKLSNE